MFIKKGDRIMGKKYLGFLTALCLTLGIGGGVANVSYAAVTPCFADNSYTITATSGRGDAAEEIEFTVVFDSDGNISEDSDFTGLEDSTISINLIDCTQIESSLKISKSSFTAGYDCDVDGEMDGKADTTLKLKFSKNCEKVTGTLAGSYFDENDKLKKITYKLTGEVEKVTLFGKLKFNPTATSEERGKIKTFEGLKLAIRVKSSKSIIARTTSNNAGEFTFTNVWLRAGLEIGWGGTELFAAFQYCTLPADPAPGLPLMEECDVGMEAVQIWTCYYPPCPWDEEE